MPAPIALQLYTIRHELERDFAGAVERIAEMGFVGVEPAGFPGTTAEKAAALFQRLGLEVPSAHVPLPLGEAADQIIEEVKILGAPRLVSGLSEADFATKAAVRESARKFNAAFEKVQKHGLSFGIHNHWAEFLSVGNKLAFDILLENLAPEVFFEIDTYWAQTAGVDPAQIVAQLGARAPLLHIKDGPCQRGVPMRPVGEGEVDFHAIVRAGGSATQWMIVEIDETDMDMMTAVQKSYTYLIQEGLARGRKN